MKKDDIDNGKLFQILNYIIGLENDNIKHHKHNQRVMVSTINKYIKETIK